MSIAWSFFGEISVLGISHLPMTTHKSTISEPYKHLRIARVLWFGRYSSMAKASFLGVVSFGRFAPDWGSGSGLPQNS
jgi:hypothetical protein